MKNIQTKYFFWCGYPLIDEIICYCYVDELASILNFYNAMIFLTIIA